MKAFQDKITGLWKCGLYGEYKYKTKEEALEKGMEEFVKALKILRDSVCQNSSILINS